MKLSNRLAAAGILLSFVIFSSCKKQIDQPAAEGVTSQSSTVMTTSCKPVIFGMSDNGAWTTIAQKWYAGEKVQYIKTHFTGRPEMASSFSPEPMLNIDWGEVAYEGNQVRVWDIAQDRLVFRATLNASGKPVASYLYNQISTGMYIDTSYYYYEGDRLQSIIQVFETRPNSGPIIRGWEQYFFNYNAAGNLNNYFARNAEVVAEFTYGSPVNGTLSAYVLTTGFKMLEFLEVTKLPTNSTLSEFKMTRLGGINPPFTFYTKRFVNYAINNGLVDSYQAPDFSGGGQNFYIGWNCGGSSSTAQANRESNTVRSLEQFKKLFRASGK